MRSVAVSYSWSHYKGFYCSLSEAQRGAKDRGQIKALVGWLPVTYLGISGSIAMTIGGGANKPNFIRFLE